MSLRGTNEKILTEKRFQSTVICKIHVPGELVGVVDGVRKMEVLLDGVCVVGELYTEELPGTQLILAVEHKEKKEYTCIHIPTMKH